MKKYNFDELIPREGTDALRLEGMIADTGRTDLLPLWVADMDFQTPDFIMRAIKHRLEQRILGYTIPSPQYNASIVRWLGHRFGWTIEKEWIHFVSGVVPGVNFALNALTEKGDGVLIMNPVYHPFHMVIESTGRRTVVSPLHIVDGRYEMDLDDIASKLSDCKVLILCNPHNPGGIVWHHEELVRLAEICAEKGVKVISDEIHADLTLHGFKHTPFASISPEAANITVTLMAPSKTFNMPGIVASYYIIPNEALRNRVFTYLDMGDIGNGNIFAFDCTMACYTDEGEDWLNQMLTYVEGNIHYVSDFLAAHCPRIRTIHPEASFLMYLDNRDLGFASQTQLVDFYQNEARLYLNDGSMFGKEGTGFMRLNVASPRKEMEEAMCRLKKAYDKAGF